MLVTVVGIGLSLSIPLLSIEMERRGASSTLIGLNTAVAGIASICTVPFVPRLAARIGVAPLLGLALVVTNDTERAREVLIPALSAANATIGERRAETYAVRLALGMSYLVDGDRDIAGPILVELRADMLDTYGPDVPLVVGLELMISQFGF